MRNIVRRVSRLVAPVLGLSLLITGCATPGPSGRTGPVANDPSKPWLYQGSDIPVDPQWLFGTLPNGLRYAVRRNGVPPGQVSIRVRLDAGSLHEQDSERGFAHFIEHLSFRSSLYVPDGEAVRVWQRLGATFGADSNAATTPTQTVYQLDLPAATASGLGESVRILSGMMKAPGILPAIVDSERSVILAEARESSDPQRRVSDATRALFFAGQRLAERAPIGTPETLGAATADTLRAFHDRWYRPERAVVVIAGDGDPRLFEQLIRQHFSDWQGKGRNPVDPDFGQPEDGLPETAVVVEPQLPTLVSMATLRPWTYRDDTIAFNQGRLRDLVAIQIINRRLESRARAGGAFLQANVGVDDVARSANGTFVNIVPLEGNWQAALREVRGVIAEAREVAPDQATIDREVAEFDSALQVGVESARSEAGAKLADDIVSAVDIRETVASAQVSLDIFRQMRGSFTPEAMLDSTRRMFTGTDTRAILSTQTADVNAQAQLAAAMAEEITVDPADRTAQADISLDQLPALGTPATIVSREQAAGIPIEYITLSNGVRLVLFANNSEAGKVLVSARFGRGSLALPADRPSPAWAAPIALVQSGIGPFGQEELDRLTTGRRISMGFATGEDSFELRGITRAADLGDQLRLMAAKLTVPTWDPNPVSRARATALAADEAARGSPISVLSRALPGLLRGGDPRYTQPDREQIAALTPDSFRSLWEPLLATGPIELFIMGDVPAEDAIRLASETFGALPPRNPAPVVAAPIGRPAASDTPIRLTHNGDPAQAAALIGWPTGGGSNTAEAAFEARKLEVLAAIFNDRLFDRLRQIEGASYSPSVLSSWPDRLPSGGALVAVSAVSTERLPDFFRLAETIAGELRTTPVQADELQRALGPIANYFARATSGNGFWLDRLAGVSWNRQAMANIFAFPTDLRRITPAEVQATAQRWLTPDSSFRAEVRAGGNTAAAPATPAAAPAR
ncbi:zinc protease [Sphingomonas jejuensis]|uniref:Zinc protease n=1 Tax=Sphingomonas jejuensis TaxID=904715 RepID=A0ABX0XR98_9SPHN|nr:M16 family metallopeptidase [Sphingomonas jejuensis]NJC35274.1 zinc protease [Sphingomonas jejuensis]